MFNIIDEEKSSALLIPGWVKEKDISVLEIFGTAAIGIQFRTTFCFFDGTDFTLFSMNIII